MAGAAPVAGAIMVSAMAVTTLVASTAWGTAIVVTTVCGASFIVPTSVSRTCVVAVTATVTVRRCRTCFAPVRSGCRSAMAKGRGRGRGRDVAVRRRRGHSGPPGDVVAPEPVVDSAEQVPDEQVLPCNEAA